jgi:hypothetical protein
MTGGVSTRTFETEGYSPDDWLPSLRPFEEKPFFVSQRPDEVSLKEYLRHEETKTGGNLVYNSKNEAASIYLEYSPYLRSEHDLMVKGYLSLRQEKFGSPLSQISVTPLRIALPTQVRPMPHIQEMDQESLPEFATIEIPESEAKGIEALVNQLSYWIKSIAEDNITGEDLEQTSKEEVQKLVE